MEHLKIFAMKIGRKMSEEFFIKTFGINLCFSFNYWEFRNLYWEIMIIDIIFLNTFLLVKLAGKIFKSHFDITQSLVNFHDGNF